jgi:hypothetical protein
MVISSNSKNNGSNTFISGIDRPQPRDPAAGSLDWSQPADQVLYGTEHPAEGSAQRRHGESSERRIRVSGGLLVDCSERHTIRGYDRGVWIFLVAVIGLMAISTGRRQHALRAQGGG